MAGVFALAVAALLIPVAYGDAQSLADVAKKEADRRGTVTSSGKVYTNGSLVADFTQPVSPPPAPVTTPKPDAASAATAKAATASDEPLQVPIAKEGTEVERQAPSDKTEGYWRGKAAAIRNAMTSLRTQIAALEGRVQGFSEAKTGTDIRERDLTSAALAKAKADLISFEEEKARLEAVAKGKNVPPAWLQ